MLATKATGEVASAGQWGPALCALIYSGQTSVCGVWGWHVLVL